MFIISQLLWVTEQYYNCVISSVSHRIWEQFTGLSVRIPSLAIVIWRLDRMENPLPTSLSGYWQEATGQLVSPREWARMRIRAGKQEARWPVAFALEWPTITFAHPIGHTDRAWYNVGDNYKSHELRVAGIALGYLGGWLHKIHSLF